MSEDRWVSGEDGWVSSGEDGWISSGEDGWISSGEDRWARIDGSRIDGSSLVGMGGSPVASSSVLCELKKSIGYPWNAEFLTANHNSSSGADEVHRLAYPEVPNSFPSLKPIRTRHRVSPLS